MIKDNKNILKWSKLLNVQFIYDSRLTWLILIQYQFYLKGWPDKQRRDSEFGFGREIKDVMVKRSKSFDR